MADEIRNALQAKAAMNAQTKFNFINIVVTDPSQSQRTNSLLFILNGERNTIRKFKDRGR